MNRQNHQQPNPTESEQSKNRLKYPRATVAVDVVVFGIVPNEKELCVFVQREDPSNPWSLPGRFLHAGRWDRSEVDDTEDSDNWTVERTREEALRRQWNIEINFKGNTVASAIEYYVPQNKDIMVQLDVMSEIGRDKRGKRVISVPFMTLVGVKEPIPEIINQQHLDLARWMPVSLLVGDNGKEAEVRLDHDHQQILESGYGRLFQYVRTCPIGKNIVSEESEGGQAPFDISDLINVYNIVLSVKRLKVDRSNLRKLLQQDRKVIEVYNKRSQLNSSSRKGGDLCVFTSRYDECKHDFSFSFNPRVKIND